MSGFVLQPRACGLAHLASLTVRIFWKMCEHTLVGFENVGASSFIPTISQRYFMDVILVQSDARTGYISGISMSPSVKSYYQSGKELLFRIV